MELLERLLQAAEEGLRTGSAIEILVLQALAYEAQAWGPPPGASQSNIAAALAPLGRALTLAEPEGYVQIFVDEGPPMAHLLYEALGKGMAPEHVSRLLAAFPVAEPEPAAPSDSQPQGADLIESLSVRELQVLQVIAEGLTNKEIASRLFLSLNTVKGHTRSIYGKLGVHSRTQASAGPERWASCPPPERLDTTRQPIPAGRRIAGRLLHSSGTSSAASNPRLTPQMTLSGDDSHTTRRV